MGAALGWGGALKSHVNIHPVFTINDWEAAQPHLDGMVESTKKEAGCLYYGWTTCGDKLHCRETYVDGAAAVTHLGNAGPLVVAMLDSGACSLDFIYIMGPEAEVAQTKEVGDTLGSCYFNVWGEDFTNVTQTASAEAQGFCTIQPTFTVNDLAAAEALMQQCVDNTRAEPGCLYYGWTLGEVGGVQKLYCREAYKDAAAVVAHLAAAGPPVGQMLESGALSLDGIEVHGPAAELEACKEAADAFGSTYWEVYDQWGKFASTK